MISAAVSSSADVLVREKLLKKTETIQGIKFFKGTEVYFTESGNLNIFSGLSIKLVLILGKFFAADINLNNSF